MKPLKKHPKQQRMEDMKFPGSVGKKTEEMRRWDKVLEESRRGLEDNRCKSCGVYPGSSHTDRCETLLEIRKRAWKEYKKNDKVTWEGREYLRSINDDMGLTIMSRLAWHLLAGLILIGSIVASAYILTHGLVCAPASFEGKTVINCFRK